VGGLSPSNSFFVGIPQIVLGPAVDLAWNISFQAARGNILGLSICEWVHCGLTLTLIAMEIGCFVLDGCAIQGGLLTKT
jgi:hypothetical protein